MPRYFGRHYATRERLYLEFKGRCYLCGRKTKLKSPRGDPLLATIDHVVPLSRGGTNEASNLRLCCRGCNKKKSDCLTH